MEIKKAGEAGELTLSREELGAVNAFAKKELKAEDVYCFSVLLCDNEVDRDYERFTDQTLAELRELFVGKTGIADHDWSSENQKARIYRTELVTDKARKNSLGEPYTYLKGCAYMLRTEGNAELIAEIEGGIKRETSVGCAVGKTVCSVCGEELGRGKCTHVKGQRYGGKLCCGELTGAVDAYEWSFVAVPAQKSAGVLKKHTREDAELKSLRERAALGDRYLTELRCEVLRLSLLCGDGLHDTLKGMVPAMGAEELEGFRTNYARRAAELFPPVTQLPGRNEVKAFSGDEYKV
jgi:hypothetical protein